MKKTLFLCMLAAASLQLSAQYKKAGFLVKDGRTYALSTTLFNMGDGKGSPIGITFSGGRDNSDKRVFAWYDLTLIPAYKFSYQTNGTIANSNSTTNVTISGSSRNVWIYGYNIGIYLTKHDPETAFSLYIPIGFNMVLFGQPKQSSLNDISEQYYNLDKSPAEESISIGIKGGLGALYNLSEKYAIKLEGGYNRVFNMSGDASGDNRYYMFTNNSYVSLGIRLHIQGND